MTIHTTYPPVLIKTGKYSLLPPNNATARALYSMISIKRTFNVITKWLFFLSRIININGGKAPLTYHLFQKLLECIEPPDNPVPTIDKEFLGDAITPIKYDHDEAYGVPTLEELGK